MTKKTDINNSWYYAGYWNGVGDMLKMLFKDNAFKEEWIIFNLKCHLENKYSAAFKNLEDERKVKD